MASDFSQDTSTLINSNAKVQGKRTDISHSTYPFSKLFHDGGVEEILEEIGVRPTNFGEVNVR